MTKSENFTEKEMEESRKNLVKAIDVAKRYGDVFVDYCRENGIPLQGDLRETIMLFLMSLSVSYCSLARQNEYFIDAESLYNFNALTREIYKFLLELEAANVNNSSDS